MSNETMAADEIRRAPKPNTMIIDADAHVNPPHDMWAEYLPDDLKDQAPVIEYGDEADYVVFEGKKRKVNLIGAQAGRKAKDYKMEGKLSDARAGGWMPAARIEDMDEDGMDAAIIFGGGPLGTQNEDLYVASFAAYNRWLSDFCAYDRSRLGGVGYVPMRDVDETVAAMKQCAELGMKAINIPAFPMAKVGALGGGDMQQKALTGDASGDRGYADEEFDPIWRTACDLGLPLTIHLGGRIPRFWDKKHFLADLLMSKFAMAEPIAVMIFGAVFQRFPDLKLVSVESGVGWFAFAANYMDETWHKQRHWVNSPLEKEPSHFMQRNVYGSFIHDRAGIETRDFRGAGNIMWSSDYPHSETTFPNSLEMIAKIFHDVPEDERNMIIGERAKALYNM